MVTVSIIIPAYNAETAIRRCLDSALKQEFRDIEVICVDDGSTDQTPQILDEYMAKDSRVIVLHKENAGVSRARNSALSVAQGKYIQFMDADDWIPDHSTKELVRRAEQTNADLVIGDFYRVVGKNVSRKGSLDTDEVLTLQEFAQLMMDSPADFYYGVLWNKLYRNDLIQENNLRMDETLSWCEDFIFNLEYLLHTERIAPLSMPVYYYVRTEGSLVSQSMNLAKTMQVKAYVFTYYNSFYKNVLDKKQYARDRLAIARFFIDSATDGAAIGILPGTKKLGTEVVQAHYQGKPGFSEMNEIYLFRKIYEKGLQSVALKFDMDLEDVLILDAVRNARAVHTAREIADYTGIAVSTVASEIEKLNGKDMIAIQTDDDKVTWIGLGIAAKPVLEAIDVAYADSRDILFAGFTKTDRDTYKRYANKMMRNARKALTTVDTKVEPVKKKRTREVRKS